MAFIYKMRSKEQWENRATSGGGDYDSWLKEEYRLYKPTAGENCIRILPPSWDNAPHYGMDVHVHYGVGPDKASVVCLFKMRKGNCPICEDRARAERVKDEALARELRAARRILVFIINKKDESQGPLAWGMPKTLDDAIMKVAKDRATGEYFVIDSPKEGYDIYFDREGEGLTTKYNGVSLAKRPSALPEQATDWLQDHVIPDAIRWRDYDEVKRLYTGIGRGEAADDPPPPPRVRTERAERSERSERRTERPERSERATSTARSSERSERSERSETVADDDDDAPPPFDIDDNIPEPSDAAPKEEGRSGRVARGEELRTRLGGTLGGR